MSASDRDAAITTAASVACGRLRSSPGTSTSIRTIAAAPTSPVSCVFAPACSATAVREPLVLTGKPWKKPAPRFAAPMPIISLLPSISWPVRAANAEAVEIVSVRDTSAMPSGSRNQQREVGHRAGQVRGGEALGQGPDERDPVAGEIEAPRARDRGDDRDQHAGDPGQPALKDQDQREADHARRQRRRRRRLRTRAR